MNILRCKVALIGDPRVGKSCIISQLTKNTCNNTYQTTLGIDYNQHEIKIKDTNYSIQFHLLEFTGFSIFRELIYNQIKDVNFILYVYDRTNLESFQNIKLWQSTIHESLTNKNVIEYLIGNKDENKEKIVVDSSSIKNMESNLKLKSWSMSARTKSNVDELFEEIGKICYENYQKFVNKVPRK